MGKRNLFTLIVLLTLISVTSFSGVPSLETLSVTPVATAISPRPGIDQYWTCYAVDSQDHTFPGLEKNRQAAQKTAIEKCSFFSEASGSCHLSAEECDLDEL